MEEYMEGHMEEHMEEHVEEEREERTAESGTEGKSEERLLETALEELRRFVLELAERAGRGREYGEALWQGIRHSGGLLQELAYFHDYGSFLGKYRAAGYTVPDALVWQVDHFKLYMDRPEDMNRYRRERLLLSAFETMLELERDPQGMSARIKGETGQDTQPGLS